jgi:hypothetical protein
MYRLVRHSTSDELLEHDGQTIDAIPDLIVAHAGVAEDQGRRQRTYRERRHWQHM